jgi:hypothetical protein
MTKALIVTILGLGFAPSLVAQPPGGKTSPTVPVSELKNPKFLRAAELLERRAPGEAPRVRFEWEHVAGAKEYLLRGNWAAGVDWTLRAAEYRVTPATATAWSGGTVTFEISLPAGDHSWSVVAVKESQVVADFARPTRLTFKLE